MVKVILQGQILYIYEYTVKLQIFHSFVSNLFILGHNNTGTEAFKEIMVKVKVRIECQNSTFTYFYATDLSQSVAFSVWSVCEGLQK